MMKIEKSFALTDLKNRYEDQKLRTFAYDIIKYQHFRANKAVHKMYKMFSNTTTITYFKAGVRYIREQIKNPRINKALYDLIDEGLKQCVQPLTPTKSERAIVHKAHKTKTTVVPNIDIPQQITEKFEYGIKKNNNIIIMNSEQAVRDFINANKILNNNNDIVGVMITIEEMKNV